MDQDILGYGNVIGRFKWLGQTFPLPHGKNVVDLLKSLQTELNVAAKEKLEDGRGCSGLLRQINYGVRAE